MYVMLNLMVIERSRSFENVKNEFSTLKLVELHAEHESVCHETSYAMYAYFSLISINYA